MELPPSYKSLSRDELRDLYTKHVGTVPPTKWSSEDVWRKLRHHFNKRKRRGNTLTAADRTVRRKVLLDKLANMSELVHNYKYGRGVLKVRVEQRESIGFVFTLTEFPPGRHPGIAVGDQFLGLAGLRQLVGYCSSPGTARWSIQHFFVGLYERKLKRTDIGRVVDKRRFMFTYESGKSIVVSRSTAFRYLKRFKGSRIEPIG